MMIRIFLLTLCFFSFLYLNGQKTILPDQLIEVSGMEYSDGQLFAINDSGNPFTLFVLNLEGQLIDSIPFPQFENVDVEDITRDEDGNWYIGDFGNNANKRKNLKIYKFNKDFVPMGVIQYNYPDQKIYPPAPSSMIYDTEAITYYDGNLHVFTKSNWKQAGYITQHYLLPTLPGTFSAKLLESIILPERVVTSAAVSPDQKHLALLGYIFKMNLGLFPSSKASVFIFELKDKNYFFSRGYTELEVPSKGATQYESISWKNNDELIVGSEKGLKKHPFFIVLDAKDAKKE